MFNQHNKERQIAAQMQPLEIHKDDLAQRIIETSQSLDLDPARSLIVGSAALYLYGIMPPSVTDPIARKHPTDRPGDVDHAVSAMLFNEIFTKNQTANGTPVSSAAMRHYGEQYALAVEPGSPRLLKSDIIARYNGRIEPEESEQRFIAYHKNAPTIPGTTVRVAELNVVYDELEHRSRADPKSLEDFNALRSYIRNHKKR